MKKVVNVGIGGKSFTMEDDAYSLLSDYLEKFRTRTKMGVQSKEVMDDLEMRIAELFSARINYFKDVVEKALVKEVVIQLGMPDGEPYSFDSSYEGESTSQYRWERENLASKKLFRTLDAKVIGGVCSGLAIYFNLDEVLIRVLFIVGLILGGAAF